jgi:hypothetical protein
MEEKKDNKKNEEKEKTLMNENRRHLLDAWDTLLGDCSQAPYTELEQFCCSSNQILLRSSPENVSVTIKLLIL